MQVFLYMTFFAALTWFVVTVQNRRRLVAVTLAGVMVVTLVGAPQPAQAQLGILQASQAVLNVINGVIQTCVDKDGNAVVVGGGARNDRTSQMAMMLSAQAADPDAPLSDGVAPTDLEGKAVVRRFLEHYLSYTPDSAPRNLAESLNMMTNNLRTFTLNKLRDDDTVGTIQEGHIIRISESARSNAPRTGRGITSCSESRKCTR